MIRHLAGVIVRPRATLAEVVQTPTWIAVWFFILAVWAMAGLWLLSTDVGQQALVDERVRLTEMLGGTVSDDEYAALQANLPWVVYLTSGGRVLLNPLVTLGVALALWLLARRDAARVSLNQVLALVVHASVILLLGQLVATPLHYLRESLTSPLTLATIVPGVEAGTAAARFFGAVDLFALWWAGVLAVGLSALTGRPAARYAWPVAAVFFGFAALAAAVIVVFGGTF